MEWTEKQKRIIGFDGGNLLVSASAGSGKTTVMLGRVMRLIDEGFSLKNMLISTFTVAAADDMRAKFAARLHEKLTETGDGRYAGELEYLPNADICTLHKWCQKLIRKYFYVTGDDPAFEIAEENECAVWRNEAISAAIAEAAADPSSDYGSVSSLYVRRRSDSPVRRIVYNIMAFADSQPDAEKWLAAAADNYEDLAVCREYLAARAAEKYKEICEAADALDAEASALELPKAGPLIDELRANAAGAGVTYSVARGITPIKPRFDALKKRVNDYNAFVDAISSARNDEAGRSARLFLSLASRARELYSASKSEKGKFDFTDLERKAKIILSSAEGDEIRGSLTHVFIDEYQDINPLQESIINLVGRDNLFFVGDIKQSIYAFRNCSPDAFAAKRDELSSCGGTVELNKNYRSKAGILRFCNSLFSRLMTENFGRVDYSSSARFAVDEADGDDGSVEIISVPATERATEKEDFTKIYSVKNHKVKEKSGRKETEAVAVTEKIVSLLRNSEYSYGDIVVLVRSRSGAADMIAENLRSVGVPVSVSSKLGVSGGRINRLLLSFLRLIDNFRDDVSLAAVMRSHLGGFTDGELARIRRAYPNEAHFYNCVTKCAKNDRKIFAFLEDIRKYTELSGVTTVGELAGKITSDKKLFTTAMSESLGIAKADGLGRLMESMSSFNGTLSEYLAYVDESEPSSDVPPQPGSVRIMTVHASKGLEFPVVLMCGLNSPFKSDASRGELTDGEFGLGMESRIAETGEKRPSTVLLAARDRKKRAELEEEMRILYVALTRAREKLVLFLGENPPVREKTPEECGCYADWIYPTAVAHGIKKAEPPEGEESRKDGVRRPLDPKVLVAMREFYSFDQSASAGEIKKSVTSLLSEESENESDDTEIPYVPVTALFPDDEYDGRGVDKRSAMARGTAFHTCLEKLDFNSPFDSQLSALEKIPDYGLIGLGRLKKAYENVRGEIGDALTYREQPFIFLSDRAVNGVSDGMLLQGVIDLLAVRGREAEIIDYKTGFLNAERREKYFRQLDIYGAAVESILGLKVTKKLIYLIDEEKFMN